MKNHPNILALFLLLVHLAGWLVLQIPPQTGSAVVFKKECYREETRTLVLQKVKNPETHKLQLTAAQENKTSETKTEIKVCPVKLAPPPDGFLPAILPFFLQPEQPRFRQKSYYFLSVSPEPDPPRFA